MYPTIVRDVVRVIVVTAGELIAEGPVAGFIRGWTPRGARVAWVGMSATVAALGYGSVVTAGRPVSSVLLVGLAALALVMVFVHLVRAELQRERERRTLELAPRRRSRG